MIDYRLYLVTDDPSRYQGDWIENVRAAVEGGVTCVQYRDTESPRREQSERIKRLRDALIGFHTPIIVNNDAELAHELKTEGVHVGQSDMSPNRVRAIVGSDCEIGFSITSLFDLRAFVSSDLGKYVDCLGIGPVFDARKTKADASPAMGCDGLKKIIDALKNSASANLSNVAIGGITTENAAEVLASGAGGLAVVSAFSRVADPYAAAKRFRQLLDTAASRVG